MGVETTSYLVFAAKFDLDELKKLNPEFYELIYEMDEEDIDHPEDAITAIYDGMGGKYCFIGKVIAKTDDYAGVGFEIIRIPPVDPAEQEKIKKLILAKLPILSQLEIDVGHYVFTHYS